MGGMGATVIKLWYNRARRYSWKRLLLWWLHFYL
jgi:hypothetical protein